jgi:hypothetical protein
MDMSSSADVPVVVFVVVAAAAATAATTRHLMWDSFCSTWKGSTTSKIGNDIDIDAVSLSSSPPPPLLLQRTTMIL